MKLGFVHPFIHYGYPALSVVNGGQKFLEVNKVPAHKFSSIGSRLNTCLHAIPERMQSFAQCRSRVAPRTRREFKGSAAEKKSLTKSLY